VKDHTVEPQDPWFWRLELTFVSIYTVEFLLKLTCLRQHFFFGQGSTMNWIEFLILVGSWPSLLLISIPSPTVLRLLRGLRLLKVLRILRVIRMFRQLQVLLQCLITSMGTLMWSLLLLAIITFMSAILIVMAVGQHFEDYFEEHGITVPEDDASPLRQYFPSVFGAMLSLTCATTGGSDWVAYYDALQPVGFAIQGFFVMYLFFVMIAVLNIILGVFVEHAMKSLAGDAQEQAEDHAFELKALEYDLRELFNEVDKDGDGISQEEWNSALQDGHLTSYMDMQGISIRDLQENFRMHLNDSPNGRVQADSFIKGCMQIRGSATSFQMMTIRDDIRRLANQLNAR